MSKIPPPVRLTEEEARAYGYDPARRVPRQSDPLPSNTDGYVFFTFQWANRPGRTLTWSNGHQTLVKIAQTGLVEMT